jgi:molybdate transport system substrate-binding protein
LPQAQEQKFFGSFFSKKNTSSYLGFLARVAREGACYIRSPSRRNRMPKLLAAILVLLPLSAHASGLTVFAAASLTDAFRDIGVLWQARGHGHVTLSFDSSSTLARQIEHGAPADVFASADEKWMDDLAAHHGIVAGTRVDIAGNTLVLAQRRADLHPLDLKPGVNIAALLGAGGRLAVGDPSHVPAGIYAKQALIKLEAWDAVADRLAPAQNVRDALQLVAHGETPMAIVYGTDVKLLPGLAVAGTFPPDSHDPITYPAAVTSHATGTEAQDFVKFLTSTDARDVFMHYGFLAP